jgi:hypothetical protein
MLRRRIRWVVTRRPSLSRPASTLAAIPFECVFPKRHFHRISGPPHRPHVIKSPSLQRDCCTSELFPPADDSGPGHTSCAGSSPSLPPVQSSPRPQDRPGNPLLATGLWLVIGDTAPDTEDELVAPTEIAENAQLSTCVQAG